MTVKEAIKQLREALEAKYNMEMTGVRIDAGYKTYDYKNIDKAIEQFGDNEIKRARLTRVHPTMPSITLK